MIKIHDKITGAYLCCDHCGGRLLKGDVYAWQVDDKGNPVDGRVRVFHASCCSYATSEGTWEIAPIRDLPLDLSAWLVKTETTEQRLNEVMQRAVAKYAIESGKRGFTVRDVQNRHGLTTAANYRRYLDHLAEGGALTYTDMKPAGGGHTSRRYYVADPQLLEVATLARVRHD